MTNTLRTLFVTLAFGGLSVPAGAQTPAEGLSITANNGQSPKQQATDRYECHSWASEQTGFDSTRPGGGVTAGEYSSRRAEYQRAMTACLEARGYNVSVVTAAPAPLAPPAPPPAPVVTPPPPPRYATPVAVTPVASPAPELKYHPLQVQIEGGYSLTAGTTSSSLDDGPNVGLGLTWTPTAALPLAVRVDGSYSWFDDREQALNINGAGYTSGHEDIYGGDADLQLDLAHRSQRWKLYLFGGAGWYREASELRRVSIVNGTICGFWFCFPGSFPAVTAVEHSTSNWHQSWNAGLGLETAIADSASFFIEARYLRIEPNDSQMQFVPIRVGLRF
jgi:opacity protein-like surface antigen